jgi:hypothetical protein
MAGWVEGSRLVEALFLPGSSIGLTADRLLLYPLIVRVGGLDAWMRLTSEQTRIDRAHRAIERWLAWRPEGRNSPEDVLRNRLRRRALSMRGIPKEPRYNAEGIRYQYHAVLDGLRDRDPTVRMLAAAVRTYRQRGIDVLVYLAPVNREHVVSLGILDEKKLEKSLAVIESAVTSSGGVFLDLHALFPDSHFRDKPGHLVYEGGIDGPRLLAEALAPPILDLLRAREGGR